MYIIYILQAIENPETSLKQPIHNTIYQYKIRKKTTTEMHIIYILRKPETSLKQHIHITICQYTIDK
jgi:hypothetical protein